MFKNDIDSMKNIQTYYVDLPNTKKNIILMLIFWIYVILISSNGIISYSAPFAGAILKALAVIFWINKQLDVFFVLLRHFHWFWQNLT